MAEFDIVDLTERQKRFRSLHVLREELRRRRESMIRPGVWLEFKPQDMWVGAFWKKNGPLVDIWVCLVPMVPIHIRFFLKQEFPPPVDSEDFGDFWPLDDDGFPAIDLRD